MSITAPVGAGDFWDGLRLVVIDTETTETPDGRPRRCVSVAAVTCRGGTVRSRWQRLTHPGVPIDSRSQAIHGITDEHLDGEQAFGHIADQLLDLLDAQEDETVVVAAHNAGFDISVLRHELQLVGRDLPDLPVIDTMRELVGLAGLDLHRPSLRALLAELGIVNHAAHDALGDAQACAEAALTLLARAVERGHTNRDDLLARLGATTTHDTRAGSTAKFPEPATDEPELPDVHLASHAEVLSARAGSRMLAAWRDDVAACATLRCVHLDGRVQRAQPRPAKLLDALEQVLDATTADGDVAGTATVLGALLPLLEYLPPRKGRLGLRNAVLAWVEYRAADLAALGRCDADDRCPACRRQQPCPLDVWPDVAARVALGDPDRYARGFFEMTGREAGTGAYTTWLDRGVDQRVADAALWRCVEHWRHVEMWVRAEQVIELGWHAGCRHPDLADAYAGQLAAAGRLGSLDKALDVCDIALSHADGSTHDGWARLRSRRSQLAGRRERLLVKPSGRFDADGHPIPARRHHPTSPRRTRPTRFVDVVHPSSAADE